ncbi:MAG: hypothetical protein KA764_02255, partial [Anaerolineales bacterium]|nr:hypothetical protein [Anaerolineales bacterium]
MRRWLRFWTPAPGPLALLTGALAGLGLGVAASALYGFSEPGRFLELFGFTFGIICAPISLVLVLAGAVIEKQPLPRAGLWGVMTLVLLGAGLFAAVGLGSSPEAGAEVGVFLYLLFCLPPAIGCAALALFFARRGLPAARAVVAQTRADRALALLAARGETTLAELAVELGRPAGECGALVDDWLRAGQLNGFFDAPRGRVYTQAAL